MKPFRLGYLVSHPIQYQAPLLRRIAAEPDIDLTVLFGSDFSVRAYQDEGFGVPVTWDVPLLEGYPCEFLPPLRDKRTVSFASPISRGLLGRLRELKPDALWIHGYATINALQGIAAAAHLGIPVLLRAESWLADRSRNRVKLFAKHLFFQALAKRISAVLPIGAHNAAYWSHYLPLAPQFPMPYAVDNAWFAASAAAASPSRIQTEFSIAPGRPLVLFASKLQERKHADHLLQAFAALPATLPVRPFLLIVGDGDERAALEAQAVALGLSADVAFAGFRNQTELPHFFAAASVFVLPSRHEPWGLIVNEALACGCPCIVSSDVGCAPDLLGGDPAPGLVFPIGDIPGLTSALQAMITKDRSVERAAAQQRMSTWSFNEDISGLRAALHHVVLRR